MTKMAESLVLKVKFKAGHLVLTLNANSTVEEFRNALVMSTGASSDGSGAVLRIFSGFPLKRRDMSNPLRTLADLGIKSGDTLIVEQPKVEDFMQRRFHQLNVPPSPVIVNAGVLMKRVVPADNSCLFTSVYFIISDGIHDSKCAKSLRKIIAEAVKADPQTYTEAFLGKSNSDYRHWIQSEDTWGGAIEISILSAHFGLELAIVDAQTARIDRFGEDKGYLVRGFLLYDGIHYDPLLFEESYGAASTPHIRTVFNADDQLVYQMVLELGVEAKKARQFTDVNKFSVKCLVCSRGFRGQEQAVEHAKGTGHSRFGET